MEVDNPLAPAMARFQQKLSERDWEGALTAAEELELDLEVRRCGGW